MNRVMRSFTYTNQVFWIQYPIRNIHEIAGNHRVHMMNEDVPLQLIAFHAQIPAFIPDNHISSNLLPFIALIKLLIQISVKSKSILPDDSAQPQILISFLKSR